MPRDTEAKIQTDDSTNTGWIVWVTAMEDASKPIYYFVTGCDNDTEAVAAVRSYPGILPEDNVKAMRPLSNTELSGFKEPLRRGHVRMHE